MNRLFHLQESSDPKTRSAFRYVTIAMVAAFVTLLAEVYLAIRIGAWQLWGAVGTVVLILVASLIRHIVFSRSIAAPWFLAVVLIVIDLDLAVI